MGTTVANTPKERVLSFIWQHALLTVSLYLMTLGVVLCVKSNLGSSVISSLPFVMSLAGELGDVPSWSIGSYTIAMNFVLVLLQILILRRQFDPMQLFQLVIGFAFGWLMVRFLNPHLVWFDRLLAYIPGFRRYLFGLARLIYRRSDD